MLELIPHLAWLRLFHYLDLSESCLLRKLNHTLKKRFDLSVKQIYSKMEGTIDHKMSYFCDSKFIYPKLNIDHNIPRINHYYLISSTIYKMQQNQLLKLIDDKNLFSNRLHRAIVNNLNVNKLKRAIKLVNAGLSAHYTLKCVELDIKQIDWAIKLKSQDICDIFCFRGAAEFNESQINNLLRVQRFTYQDCFAFYGAEQLNDSQIDVVIENKKLNKLDYDSLVEAGCVNIFKHN